MKSRPPNSKRHRKGSVRWINFDSTFIKPRTHVRMGEGDYVARPNHHAQFIFVKTLWDIVPDTRLELERLADDVHADTRSTIESWAHKYNLSSRWLMSVAEMLVNSWREYPQSRGVIAQFPLHRIYEMQWSAPKAWNPLLETEADYDAAIDQYKSDIRKQAEEAGLVATPIKRNVEHFKWLVAHQVLGYTYKQVADRFESAMNCDHASIAQAIVDTAAEIELALRRAPKR